MSTPSSPRKFTVEEFIKCKEILLTGSELERYEIITRVRKASSIEDSPPLEQIRKSDIIPVLMTLHKDKNLPESVVQDILWTMTNVASGSSDETLYIVKLSGIDYFVEFLTHPSEAIWGQALWGLANLAGESSQLRDTLLAKDVLQLSLNIYYRAKKTMKLDSRRTIGWMVNNLCRNKPSVEFSKVKDCIQYLTDSLRDNDNDVIVENLWACAYLTETGDIACKNLMDSGIMLNMANLLMSNIDSLVIVTPGLRTCSNIVSGNDNLTERIINLGVVPSIMSLFNSQKPAIRREVCFFFSNIAAGTENQINYLSQFPTFLTTVKKIISQDEASIVLEAIWIVTNILQGGTVEHARKILELDIFIEIFKSLPALSNKGVFVALDGFKHLLNHGMSMLTTPQKLVDLMSAFKNEVTKFIVKKGEPSYDGIMEDINLFVEDLQEYAVADELAEKKSSKLSH